MSSSQQQHTSRRGTVVALGVVFLIGCASLFVKHRFENAERVTVPIEDFPRAVEGWTGTPASTLESASREILQLDRYIRRLYKHPDAVGDVFVYVGYWTHQTGEHQAAKHTPKLCLPSNGWKINPLGVAHMELPFADRTDTLAINRLVGEIEHHRSLIYYWFVNGTDYYPEEWHSLARISWNALLGKRTDGGIIEISIPIPTGPDGLSRAEADLKRFLSIFMPRFDDMIRNRTQRVGGDDAPQSNTL